MRAVILSFFLIVYTLATMAQSSYTGGLHFEIKPTVSFQKDWKLNGRVGSRALFFEGSSMEPFTGIAKYERIELELVLTKKTSSSTSFGGGYLIRNQKGAIKHRLIQQFSVSNNYETFRLGHRFRFDETFQREKATLYRFRYRLNFEKPLGLKKGKDEKVYFILNNEYIPSLQNDKYQMEMRLLPGLGFKLNDSNKLEVGLDYRIENLFTDSYKQLYLLYLSWSPSLSK